MIGVLTNFIFASQWYSSTIKWLQLSWLQIASKLILTSHHTLEDSSLLWEVFFFQIKNSGQIIWKIHTVCSYYAWKCKCSFWHRGQQVCHLIALRFLQCCAVKKALLCQRFVSRVRTVSECIHPHRKQGMRICLHFDPQFLQPSAFSPLLSLPIFPTVDALDSLKTPAMQKQHGQRTPTWARVGSGSENASEKLVSSRAPRAQNGSRLLVLLQCIRDSTEAPLQQAGCSASELDLLGLGKPLLLLFLTWPEGALWTPGVPRTRHTGAGNSLLCRNSVLALGRSKIRVIARGGGYSHGAKDKREGTALEPAQPCQHSCHPPSQKQTVKSTSQVSSCASLHFLRTVYLSYNF